MNLVFFYIAFAFGTLAGSSFLYNIVIYSQTLDAVKGFSGIVFLFLFLPFPLIFLYTGFLLDHFQKKLVLLFFQFLHLLAVFLAGYFDQEIEKTPYLLLGIAFINGMGMTAVLPGRLAMLREVVDTHRIVFHTIIGNLLLIFFFGMSPLFVGYLRESFSFSNVFIFISWLHSISILSLLFVYSRKISKPNQNPDTPPELVLAFLKRDKVARQVLYMSVLSMLALGPIQVILPKYIRDVLNLGELARGSVLVALGPGLFLGGLATILFHHSGRKGLILLITFLFSSVFFLGLVPFQKPEITSIFLLLFGITGGVISSLLPAILQKRSEDHLRGRVLSLYTVCFQFTPAVSGLVSAFLGDSFGVMYTFLGLGIVFLLSGILGFIRYAELRDS